MTVFAALERWLTMPVLASCVAVTAVAQDRTAREVPSSAVASADRSGAWVRARESRVPPLRRTVALRLRNASLQTALDAIARAAGLSVAYGEDVLRSEVRVTLQVDRLPLVDALTMVLDGTPLDAFVSVRGDALLVRAAQQSGQGGTLVGQVTDAKSQHGVSGAEVLLNGSRWRTTTDTGGRYRLEQVDAGTYMLTVRRPGYGKQTQRVTVRADHEDTVNIALEQTAVPLDSLVTTATGQQRRRDLGNSITTIKADSIMKHAVIRNLTDLLDKRVPGLTTQHTTGAPGDPARLRLRGLNSALRSNDPVVIVDGVRIYAVQSEARSGNLTNLVSGSASSIPAPSPLDQIDPNIIEKVEVFKGPSAATLYGADAANGVIVITTKRGKPGPTRWNASITHAGTTQPGRWPTGYYRWGRDLYSSSTRFCTLLDVRCVPDSLAQFQALNVPSLTVVGQGRRTALSLTASGGAKSLTYSVTGSYGDETGLLRLPDFEVDRFRAVHQREAPDWMRNAHRYQTWSVTSNVTALLSRTAEVTLSSSLARSEQRRTSLENQLSALQGTYIDTINQIYYRPTSGYVLNQSADILSNYYQRTTASTVTVTTALRAKWEPRSWFTINGEAGLNIMPRDDQSVLPGGLVTLTDSGTLARGTGRSVVSTLNLFGALRRPLGHGFIFQTSVGADFTSTSISDLASSAGKVAPGTTGFTGATGFYTTGNRASTSVFGWHIEPTIRGDRLSLSTGLRLDGGSAYGTRISGLGSGGGGFLRGLLALPKLNGSWVVSEEPWFPLKALFSSLRLRGAYGQAQVQPGAADRLRLYDQTVRLTNLGNTQIRPERSTEVEGGFEADVLDSRLSFDVTAYSKLQIDALMRVELPTSVNGGGSVLKNIGNIRNRGVDIVLGITPVRLSALTWHTDLIYNRNTNTLLKLGRGVDPNPDAGLVEGYPVGSRWSYPIVGFADENGNGVLQPSEIRLGDSLVYMGRLLPAYTLTLNTNIALFGGAVGVTAGASYDAGMTQINALEHDNWVLDRALVDPSVPLSQQAAVIAADQQIQAGPGYFRTTQYGLMQEVSTWRFHSLSVSYRAPVRVARLVRAQDLSVALQGSNLGLHSNYRGKDPDVNAWSPGEYVTDTGQLPQPRTWQLAVFLGY